MKYEAKFRVVISSLVAYQVMALPAMAADPLGNLNGYLSAIAAKNGTMYMNAAAPSRSGASTLPTASDMVNAIHNLPKAVSYPNGTPTPDPTPDEALTLIPPVTDVQQVNINGKMVDPIFGSITAADQTLTGMFEDLSNVDMSQFEPTSDPNWFDAGTDANGNALQLSPAAYEIVAPVFGEDERAMARKTIALTQSVGLLEKPIAFVVGNGGATGSLSFVEQSASSRLAAARTASLALLSLPAVPFAADDAECVMPSQRLLVTADTTHGYMLKGRVETEVEGSSFICVRDHAQEIDLACGGMLNAGKGSMMWIERDGDEELRVKAASDVSVRVGGVKVDLMPGQELVWAKDASHAAELVKDGVARRQMTHHALPDGSVAMVSEFSLVHMLSKQSDESVAPHRERILKTAAALNVACRHHGRYQIIASNR